MRRAQLSRELRNKTVVMIRFDLPSRVRARI